MDDLQRRFNGALADTRRAIHEIIGKSLRTFDGPELAKRLRMFAFLGAGSL